MYSMNSFDCDASTFNSAFVVNHMIRTSAGTKIPVTNSNTPLNYQTVTEYISQSIAIYIIMIYTSKMYSFRIILISVTQFGVYLLFLVLLSYQLLIDQWSFIEPCLVSDSYLLLSSNNNLISQVNSSVTSPSGLSSDTKELIVATIIVLFLCLYHVFPGGPDIPPDATVMIFPLFFRSSTFNFKRPFLFSIIFLLFIAISILITNSAILLFIVMALLSTAPFILLIPKRYSAFFNDILEVLIKAFLRTGLLRPLFLLYTWLNSVLSYRQYQCITICLGINLLSFIVLSRYLFHLKLVHQPISIIYMVFYFFLVVGVFIRFVFNYSYFIIPLTFTRFPKIGLVY